MVFFDLVGRGIQKVSPITPKIYMLFVPRFYKLPINVESGDMSSTFQERGEGVFKIVSHILLSLRTFLQVSQNLDSNFLLNWAHFLKTAHEKCPRVAFLKTVPGGNSSISHQNTVGNR